MKYILDTNVLIWFIENNEKLPSDIQEKINEDNNDIYFSIASLWEISLKYAIGKLKLPVPLEEFFYDIENEYGFQKINLTNEQILFIQKLSFIHKDPFDRLIYATAKTENMRFLYTDEIFDEYEKVYGI